MKKYAVLGYPLKHTMSPQIHKMLFELDGVTDYEYTIEEIAPEKLEAESGRLFSMDGFNVTIPYKVDIVKYLDRLDSSAERYGAVNCVASEGDDIYAGYNTDCDGFLRALEAAGAELKGRVLQCGCGGVGRMIAIETIRHGADITISLLPGFENTADPIYDYAEKNNLNNKINITYPDKIKGAHYDLLINASPVGMFPNVDASPVVEDVITRCDFVFDVIYNPETTKLMETARKNGIKAAGGMSMLVWQAAVAHEYWNGAKYQKEDIEKIIAKMSEKND